MLEAALLLVGEHPRVVLANLIVLVRNVDDGALFQLLDLLMRNHELLLQVPDHLLHQL